jgi:hypothetical protein
VNGDASPTTEFSTFVVGPAHATIAKNRSVWRPVSMRSEVIILLLCLVGLRTASAADCRKARPDQTPHGANGIIIHAEQTVGHLQGVVFIGNGGPASGVVVEIYRYESNDNGFQTTRFLKSARRSAACLTTENGVFAFTPLKPGRYLLRAGTVAAAGINELHAIFRVMGNGKAHNVEIRLTLGT